MKYLKIIRIGIFASILGLLGGGYGNKRATLNESISSDSIVTVGKLIEQTIFQNNNHTIYDIAP